MKNWKTSAEQILTAGPVVPVIVINKLEQAVPLAKALVAGGVRVLEVTLRTACGLEAIRAIAKEVPETPPMLWLSPSPTATSARTCCG